MYDENGRKRFSILRMIFICLVILFFIFFIMWIFSKAKQNGGNCDNTNDSNVVFNNNINYLQNVGTDYFTVDKLPKVVGESVTITLAELLDKKYILQITDKDGKLCSGEDSYVSVTKTETGYEMKTLLVCGSKGDFIIKELGCHDLCNNNCGCSDITEYEYSRTISKGTTTYTCPSGYTKNGSKCTLTKLVGKVDPTIKTTTTTDMKPANKVVISGTKTKVDTVVTNKTETTDSITTIVTPEKKEKVDLEVVKNTTTTRVYTDPTKKTKTTCKEVTETKPGCVVQCKTEYQNGIPTKVCNSCTITYNKCETTNTWICPSTYSTSGSGSSTTCYKDITNTTYSCPSGYEGSSGSGETLKCWKYKIIPAVTKKDCPSGYTMQNNKCTKTTKVYTCPSNSNYHEGSGETLKCYVVTEGKYSYNCNGYDGYSLSGTNCVKTIVTKTTICPNGYKLENNSCNKYSTTTKKATAKKSNKSTTEYKWSTKESLSGWTRTGNTRLVENKTCKK